MNQHYNRIRLTGFTLLCGLFFSTGLSAQSPIAEPLINRLGNLSEFGEILAGDYDKCGPIDEKALEVLRTLAGDGWGYGYNQLLQDLEGWKKSPYVDYIRSIGQSVQGRDIWEIKITAVDRSQTFPRHTITIHARTHPHETQSSWVCDHIIRFLLSEDPYAAALREQCTFHIIPMYNPDGVELMTTRYNANGVDLEREWDKPQPQVEAAALKRRFGELMNSEEPIEIALNLHSSSDLARYFWYHDSTGTSEAFARLERNFINGVRTWFEQIMPWDFAVSWKGSAPTHFPESWFWLNYGTEVMALTYEEDFTHNLETPDAYFDSAAVALLRGIGDYLDLNSVAGVGSETSSLSSLSLTVRSGDQTSVALHIPGQSNIDLRLFDGLGREVKMIYQGEIGPGDHRFTLASRNLPSGIYFLQLTRGVDRIVQRVPVVN